MVEDLRGYTVEPGIMVGKDSAAYWPQAALTGWRETTMEDQPGRVRFVQPVPNCRFRRPAPGELVANVHIGRSSMRTPVFAFSRKKLSDRAATWIDAYKEVGEEAPTPSDAEGDMLRAVDVVVTETAQPVYLVLQNEWSSVVWNIHVAPTAKLAHVAVLGSGSIGVANLDSGLRAEFMNESALEECKIVPVREPADHWLFVRRVKDGTAGDLAVKLEENRELFRTYSRWFFGNFGIGGETDAVGISKVSQVLVGPLPEDLDQRVAFKPLAGAEVRIAQEDNVLVANPDNYRETHDKLVRALAEKMVGGDIKTLAGGS